MLTTMVYFDFGIICEILGIKCLFKDILITTFYTPQDMSHRNVCLNGFQPVILRFFNLVFKPAVHRSLEALSRCPGKTGPRGSPTTF